LVAAEKVDLRRPHLRELQERELQLMDAICKEPTWLARHDEAALRWALSLARLSKVPVLREGGGEDLVDLGHASDDYRRDLLAAVEPMFRGERVNREAARVQLPKIRELVRDERRNLLKWFQGRLPAKDLDRATRRRPFALVLGGGGGTGYIFVGALQLLEEAGLKPNIVVGSSMGSILGAFRCRDKDFDMKNVNGIIDRLSWRRVFRLFDTEARFGLPATLKLHLREVIGHEFERDGRFLRMKDLPIPFRVCVGGLSSPQDPAQLNRYAHLLDDVEQPGGLRMKTASIARTLQEFTNKPVKPVILGGDDLTQEFDVLDAIGFSSAVPGVIHYDILRDDPRMVDLVSQLMEREGVFRLVDGGVADNLPAREAWNAVQSGAVRGRDPFVLALDGFAPQWNRHLLFLPLMRIAQENSRMGRKTAHVTISYKKVLSPLAVVPTAEEFRRAVENGREETQPFVDLVRKMVGPIPDPPGVVTEMDGT